MVIRFVSKIHLHGSLSKREAEFFLQYCISICVLSTKNALQNKKLLSFIPANRYHHLLIAAPFFCDDNSFIDIEKI